MTDCLADLDPGFRAKAVELLAKCAARGVTMRPYFGVRDCLTQAKLWRQSRSREEIKAKILELRGDGATYLAGCIEKAGPQSGRHATDAIPGLSWHQWGQALDCFWLDGGKASWQGAGYDVYREEAAALGLTTISWEHDHVQLRPEGSPLQVFSIVDIDLRMQARFGSVV